MVGSSVGPWRGEVDGESWFFTSPYSSDMWDSSSYGGGQNGVHGSDEATAIAHAHVNWRETPRAYLFHAELPEARKEDVKVEVKDNLLKIRGQRTVEREERCTGHRIERRCGSFVRLFRLPENINLDEIKCGIEHGLLTVIVPKEEEVEQQRTRTNVRISGGTRILIYPRLNLKVAGRIYIRLQ
ncbi:16.9 kDa class I heat shock protein 1-like [Tripterygium wilfordii]|uniref:16.9 kDa class I heat shock protein 1-like n=1 Tax=Tripterygium wilfordii TaxID=458696 RepID=A0A7J7DSN1_TRIWF|nr:17.6 kDa class I heat shock protein-like [Tripterygium wilfordii]KAF5749303.1 16.9 kDa class I heat shock protein 1-like [Tripterygium wilfordii]